MFPLVRELAADRIIDPGRGDLPGAGRLQVGLLRVGDAPPSPRAVADAALTATIAEIHQMSRCSYGAPRVQPSSASGWVGVWAQASRPVDESCWPAGICHRRKRGRHRPLPAPHEDLVQRRFMADAPNGLWCTDITEHPTEDGKVYCCAVMDVFSRAIVGWSMPTTSAPSWSWTPCRWPPGGATRSLEPWSTPTAARKADSTGRRNTSILEVSMGRPAGWMTELTGRSPMKSPGAPRWRREVERAFWRRSARGCCRVRPQRRSACRRRSGSRWFRHGGGMPTFELSPLSGRYLSFAEREEIAPAPRKGGVREIARRLGRAPSTVSRELRRNAATRGGKLDYRASVAQWKAELMARRPKTAKLVANERLREYVQDRLAGQVRRPDGTPVARTGGRWKGRNKPHRGDRRWVQGVEPGADRPPAQGRLPRR